MDSDNQLDNSEETSQTDQEFIESVLKCYNINAEPDVQDYLLDQMHTLIRDQLLAARCFSRLAGKPSIDDEDMRIANMDKTDDVKFVPKFPLVKPMGQHLSTPTPAMGLLLPPWRNCQVGVNAQLKQLVQETESSESTDTTVPPNKMPRLGPKHSKTKLKPTNFVP